MVDEKENTDKKQDTRQRLNEEMRTVTKKTTTQKRKPKEDE